MGLGLAIVGSAAISATAGLLGSRKSAKAAKSAADTQAAATRYATDAELEMFYQARDDLAPWKEYGKNALADYAAMIRGADKTIKTNPFTGDLMVTDVPQFDPTKEPGYEFGFNTLIKEPYMSGASAAGKRLSGNTLRDLTKFASDYGSTKYENYLNRFLNLANMGQGAAAGSANAAMRTGENIGSNILSEGLARAQGKIGAADAWNQGLAGIAGAGQNALQNYMDYKILQKIGVA